MSVAKSNTLRRLVRRVIRHVGPYEQTEGHGFKVEFLLGDEAWSASIHFHHTWRGRFYWQCWFLPWFPSPPNSVLDRSHPSTVTERLTKNNP